MPSLARPFLEHRPKPLRPARVARGPHLTLQRIQGAVAVYLLLGVAWAGIYELIGGIWPGAFRFSEAPRSRAELTASLAYYSFVTLTTMGYGDITPLHPVARSAAIRWLASRPAPTG